MDALTLHRIHFGFTITYHYLFPQLTMGLALLIVILKTIAFRASSPEVSKIYEDSARFWGKLFAVNFLLGVVTGIPMEFQFGTNGPNFHDGRAASSVCRSRWRASSLSFWSRRSLGSSSSAKRSCLVELHWLSAFLVFLGSWISGFFIIVTNAFMQHPVGYRIMSNESLKLRASEICC